MTSSNFQGTSSQLNKLLRDLNELAKDMKIRRDTLRRCEPGCTECDFYAGKKEAYGEIFRQLTDLVGKSLVSTELTDSETSDVCKNPGIGKVRKILRKLDGTS